MELHRDQDKQWEPLAIVPLRGRERRGPMLHRDQRQDQLAFVVDNALEEVTEISFDLEQIAFVHEVMP